MGSIEAISIDFWNTLVDSSNGHQRRLARYDAVREVFEFINREWDEEAVDDAFHVSYETFEHNWYGHQRTMSASECAHVVWDHLGISIPDHVHDTIVRKFEDSILVGMPSLLPGARGIVESLAARYKLALISDTAMSPGAILRKVLEKHDVAKYFDVMVFSDETGVAKPHPKAFSTALDALEVAPVNAVHVGDIERTDVVGAVRSGMRAILFRGDSSSRYHGDQHTGNSIAHGVAHSWEEVAAIIAEWNTPTITRVDGKRKPTAQRDDSSTKGC